MRVDRRELAAIFAGGVIGALARLGLVEALPSTPGQWPWATFVANVVGTLALGYFTTRLLRRRVPVVTLIVDTPARIDRWFAIVDALTDETGLVTSEQVPALRAAGPGIARGGLRLADPGVR